MVINAEDGRVVLQFRVDDTRGASENVDCTAKMFYVTDYTSKEGEKIPFHIQPLRLHTKDNHINLTVRNNIYPALMHLI